MKFINNRFLINRIKKCTFLLLCLSAFLNHRAKAEHAENDRLFQSINIRNLSMAEFASLLSKSGAIQVIASKDAAETNISFVLQNVSAKSALDAACRANGLVSRSGADNIHYVYTKGEFNDTQGLYNDETMLTIQLKYATASDVGETLRNLFADRLVWVKPNLQEGDTDKLISNAIDRMELLSDNEKFGSNSGSSGDSSNDNNDNDNDNNNDNDRNNSDSSRTGAAGAIELEMFEQFRTLLKNNKSITGQAPNERQVGIVFVSAFPSTNVLLLRSTDDKALKQIKETVAELDKPTPQVLLEVKVLDLDLGDGKSIGVDWLYKRGDGSIGYNNYNQSADALAGELGATIQTALGAGTGFTPRTTQLKLMSDNITANIEAMKSEGRLVQLATPTLLVANGEASRVFVGSRTNFLKDVEVDSSTPPGSDTTITTYDPEISQEDVGMQLLINPRIHADRSVTLRILQEDSSLGQTRPIEYGRDGESITVQDVNNRSVVSTIVAQDGNWVATGGLIRESEVEKASGVPFLMDIPYLGRLFRSDGISKTRSELIILIRPVVLLAPGEEAEASKDLLEKLSKHPSITKGGIKELDVDLPKKRKSTEDKKEDGEIIIIQ